jgi:acyl-CoA thioesterase
MSEPPAPDFIAWIGFETTDRREGYVRSELRVEPRHLNPYGTLHGGVLYAMADTGMGAALAATLGKGETSATIGIDIVYIAAVTSGEVRCETRVLHRGGRTATLESELHNTSERGDRLVAKALGTFALFQVRG